MNNYRVLIIDDHAVGRKDLVKLLRDNGFVVYEASNGRKGLELFNKKNPDLVISDIFMPEKDGLEMIMELRRIGKNVKIISISEMGIIHLDFLKIAKQLGADRVLSKPFSGEQILALVNELLIGSPVNWVEVSEAAKYALDDNCIGCVQP
jgi:CheY-like chemotaxis protein